MTHARHLFFTLLLSAALVLPANDILARGSSGSFSGGRSSSSSFSSSRSSSGSSWGSSSSSSGSVWGSSSSTKSAAPASAADSAMSTKVNRAGNTTSRSAAIDQQTAQNQPRTYATEPATRPSDIPWGQTLPNGSYATIYYDPMHQGYGFWNAAGQWMMWSAIMNSGHNNYYYGSGYGPGYGPGYGGYGYQHHSSMLPTLIGLLIIGGIIVAAIIIYRKHSDEIASCLDRNPAPNDFSTYAAAASSSSHMSNNTPPIRRPANLAPWLHFPPGSFITLSDNQSMEDSQKRGEGFQGIRFAVESTLIADDMEGFGSWVMLRLNDNHQRLFLLVKAVDEAIDYRLYYANEDFHPARREEVIRRGDTWLFEPPQDENNFEPGDLRYAAELIQTADEKVITYVRKDQGERHANVIETPSPLGLTEQIATVVEYSTSDATENPELMVFEIGAASRRTGEVTLYLGCPIRESEIDVLKAASV